MAEITYKRTPGTGAKSGCQDVYADGRYVGRIALLKSGQYKALGYQVYGTRDQVVRHLITARGEERQ